MGQNQVANGELFSGNNCPLAWMVTMTMMMTMMMMMIVAMRTTMMTLENKHKTHVLLSKCHMGRQLLF